MELLDDSSKEDVLLFIHLAHISDIFLDNLAEALETIILNLSLNFSTSETSHKKRQIFFRINKKQLARTSS